jgi:hypothetical protein
MSPHDHDIPPGGEFETPVERPGQSKQSEDDSNEDARIEEFAAPGSEAHAAEQASLALNPQGLLDVDSRILALKEEIESRLLQTTTFAAGARAADALSGVGNIQGVAIGEATDGSSGGGAQGVSSALEPGGQSLRVYVAEPGSIDQVKAALVDTLGVRALSDDRVPVTVVVTGLIDAQPHRFRVRPAPGGVSVGHYKITAGTIGCLSTGKTAPRSSRLLVLSNNHVLANSNNAVYGDCICQPGPYDGGRCPADQIAILERFVPINFTGGANYVDCATGFAWPDRVRRELVYLQSGSPAYFRISSQPVTPAIGMMVGKSGRTTQLTVGRVAAVGATIRVTYGSGRVALFQDQIEIVGTSGSFSAGGDSGSSIWTWNSSRNPVGLLFAGGGASTFANRITRVLTALDIQLYT